MERRSLTESRRTRSSRCVSRARADVVAPRRSGPTPLPLACALPCPDAAREPVCADVAGVCSGAAAVGGASARVSVSRVAVASPVLGALTMRPGETGGAGRGRRSVAEPRRLRSRLLGLPGILFSPFPHPNPLPEGEGIICTRSVGERGVMCHRRGVVRPGRGRRRRRSPRNAQC